MIAVSRRPMIAVLALLLIGAAPARAVAGGATDALRPAIDHVRRILDDPALKGPARTPERRAALRGVLEGVIDFPEAARRALAMHWRDRTDAERVEFVALFKDLVTYSYIVKIEPYAGEPVAFTGESEHDGMTTVQTRIQTRQGPLPVDYRMHVRDGRWLVYDVLVEGVSLVGNYRAQFNSIIQTSSFAELIRRMKVRLGELAAASAASSVHRRGRGTLSPFGGHGMRHDPIDPARSPGAERPAVAMAGAALEAVARHLDALEQRALATIVASEEELRALESGAAGGPQDDTARMLAITVLADVATRERKVLDEIAAARARLHEGTFGTCETCGATITASRLEALPTARHCVACQANAERSASEEAA
jgi:phospholipid transport system substrate-binding protein